MLLRLLAVGVVATVIMAPAAQGQGVDALLAYFTKLTTSILPVCGGDKGPESCSCDNDPNNGSIDGFPFSKVLVPTSNPDKPEINIFAGQILAACSPGKCLCEDGTEISARPPEMEALLATCPAEGDGIIGCGCAYSVSEQRKVDRGRTVERRFMKRPWDVTKFLLDCRPVNCQCESNPGVDVPVSGYGCPNGGAMYCKKKSDFICKPPAGEIVTKDTPVLSQAEFLKAKTDDYCICPNGELPICKSKTLDGKSDPLTNHPTCPDGGLPDFSIGSPGSGLTQCKLPSEYRDNSVARATSEADKAKFAAAVLVGDLAE